MHIQLHTLVPYSGYFLYRDHENVSMNWPKIHCSRKFYPPKNTRYTVIVLYLLPPQVTGTVKDSSGVVHYKVSWEDPIPAHYFPLSLISCLSILHFVHIYLTQSSLSPPCPPFLRSRFLSLPQIKGYWDDFLEYCPVAAGKEKASSESFVQLWKAVPPQ